MSLSDTLQSLTQREKVLGGVLGIVMLATGSMYIFSMLSSEKTMRSQVVMPLPAPARQDPTEIPIMKDLQTANIKNPFQVPPQYQVRKETTPSSPGGVPMPKPVSGIPILCGIIASGPIKMAILELGGNSDTLGIGDTLGGYTIVSITDIQVVLNGPEGRQVLNIGR
jgi:type II secretory pathway component PulC